jgi:hypothetical protein
MVTAAPLSVASVARNGAFTGNGGHVKTPARVTAAPDAVAQECLDTAERARVGL